MAETCSTFARKSEPVTDSINKSDKVIFSIFDLRLVLPLGIVRVGLCSNLKSDALRFNMTCFIYALLQMCTTGIQQNSTSLFLACDCADGLGPGVRFF
jgi:hypothetical protein